MTKQGAITARMTSPDVCVADVNNFSIMERRGRREAPAPSHHPRCQIRVSGGSEGGRAPSRRSLKRPGRLWPPIPRGPHLCLSPRPPHLICVLFVVIRSRCGISSRSGELRRRASVLSGVDWFHPQPHAGLHSPSTDHPCDAINGNSASSPEALANLQTLANDGKRG